MRRILLAAVLAATAASSAAAQTVHWTAELEVEKWVVGAEEKEYYGYWRPLSYGKLEPQWLTYRGVPYRVELFYITNEPRSLLIGLNAWPPERDGLAFAVDGRQFAVADISRWPDEDVAAWDNSGLDWSDGQVVTVELVDGATPVPALPLVGTVLIAFLLVVRSVRGRAPRVQPSAADA